MITLWFRIRRAIDLWIDRFAQKEYDRYFADISRRTPLPTSEDIRKGRSKVPAEPHEWYRGWFK